VLLVWSAAWCASLKVAYVRHKCVLKQEENQLHLPYNEFFNLINVSNDNFLNKFFKSTKLTTFIPLLIDKKIVLLSSSVVSLSVVTTSFVFFHKILYNFPYLQHNWFGCVKKRLA